MYPAHQGPLSPRERTSPASPSSSHPAPSLHPNHHNGHNIRHPGAGSSISPDFNSPRIPLLEVLDPHQQQPNHHHQRDYTGGSSSASSPLLKTDMNYRSGMGDDSDSLFLDQPTPSSTPGVMSPQLRKQSSSLSSHTHGIHHSSSLRTMNSQASLGMGTGSGTVRRGPRPPPQQMPPQQPDGPPPNVSMGPRSKRNPSTGMSTMPSTSAIGTAARAGAMDGRSGTSTPAPSSKRDNEADKERDKSKERVAGSSSRDKSGKDDPASAKDGKLQVPGAAANGQPPLPPLVRQKYRNTPHLPHSNVERAPSSVMYWSRAPVHGALPTRNMRAHSVTLVDNTAWVFGGCDDKGCWRDVWCFDIETFHWSHPEMLGDLPPPCRAHTATLVDKKLYVFGGGEGPTYYNDLYILDTQTYRWTKPTIPLPHPLPRRAHTAVFYGTKIYIFGGGNGHRALNDLWSLDVAVPPDKLKWEQIPIQGIKPGARGYHTANLVGSVMIVLGGSDGRECFDDVWVLDLDTFIWREVRPDRPYSRLSHSSTQVGSYLFVIGGHDGNKYSHDLLLFNLVTLQFEPRPTLGRPPSSRGYHVSALADSRVFVFGGFDGHTVFDDVWILDLAAAAYLPQVTSFGIMVE